MIKSVIKKRNGGEGGVPPHREKINLEDFFFRVYQTKVFESASRLLYYLPITEMYDIPNNSSYLISASIIGTK